jgi:tetratricopeptide (TPR) repeat protein/DNA-binding winged helix-turn-helix (wHTH) protein
MLYRLEGFEVVPDREEIRFSGAAIPLRNKAFHLLLYLLRHRERAVGRDELLREVWPNTVVTENSVAQCVIELRRTLGDDARQPRFIRTVGRAGYRFVGPVEEASERDIEARPLAPLVPVTEHSRNSGNFVLPNIDLSVRSWKALALAAPVLAGLVWLAIWSNRPKLQQAEESALAMTGNLKAARAYLSGIQLAQQYHPEDAVKKFEEALRLDPGFTMAKARLGYVYSVRWLSEEKGKPYLESAYAERGNLSDRDRLYIMAWYDTAHLDFAGAIRDYRELLGLFPRETEAHLELGRMLVGESRYDEAQVEFEAAIRIDPAAPLPHNSFTGLLLSTRQFGRALEEAKLVVKLLPLEPNAYDTLGLANEAAGNYEEAERAYRQGLELDPRFEVGRLHLADALFHMGRWREAKKELQRYIDDAPSDSERLWGADQLAMIALRQGNLAEAARQASVQSVDGYHDQQTLLALKRGDLAAADELLNMRPEHAERGQRENLRYQLYVRGERALAAHDTKAALAAFQHAVAVRTPFHVMEWYEDCLGNAYLRLGRFDEAIAEYRRVLAIFPRLAPGWHGLGKAYLAKHQDAAARDAFAKVVEIWHEADTDIPELAEAKSALTTQATQALVRIPHLVFQE